MVLLWTPQRRPHAQVAHDWRIWTCIYAQPGINRVRVAYCDDIGGHQDSLERG
jgi:hypothetical protein